MKKLVIMLVILTLAGAKATPIIGNFSISPSNLWSGEAPTISLNCYDENNTISWIYSNIVGPYMVFPTLNFTQIGVNYVIDSSRIRPYLDRTGLFTVSVYCVNNVNETVTATSTFSISDIYMNSTSVQPNPAYIGDTIEVDLNVKKDGLPLYSGINFQSLFNNQAWTFNPTQPYYDTRKGWILKMTSPNIAGDYNLKITADYSGKTIYYETKITIKQPVQFEILNLDNKTELKLNDNITFRLKASDKASKINLTKDNIAFTMDSSDINSNNFYISSGSSYDDITLTPPTLSSGQHLLKIKFNYGQFSSEEARKIFYMLPISGQILNFDDNPMQADFIFSSSDLTKKISTSSDGSYSGLIYPGEYNLQIKFQQSTVNLSDVDLKEENLKDVISYNYLEDFDVLGIKGAGLYYYDISPHFSDGYIKMYYQRRYLVDEDSLGVYRCGDWNIENKVCNEDWGEVDFELDKNDGAVKVDAIDYGAFVIGNKKSISLDFSTDKNQYYSNDIMVINGVVQDDVHNPLADATLTVKVEGKSINASAKSSSSGIVTLKMNVPDEEGNYTLLVNAEKTPYVEFSGTYKIEVLKRKELSIVVPNTVRINQDGNSTVEVSVVNIGQTYLSDISLSISGIPEEYYTFNQKIDSLRVGEERKIKVNFFIPKNASEGTFSGKFKAEYEGFYKEEIFGFTILPKLEEKKDVEPQKNSKSLITTGRIVLPTFTLPNFKLIYLVPLGLVSFLIAFLLKKSKKKISEEDEIKKIFSEIKLQIRSKDQKIVKNSD